MTGSTTPLAIPSITQWEEAGTSLANALSRYLDSCISLGTNSLEEGARPNDLVACIDSKLESIHVTMEQQIAQARSALSKTRNDLASPVHRLPEEILDEIFAYVIYSPQYSYTEFGVHLAEMEEHLLKIYRSLYALLGVCSPWKKAILNQGYFWSTVPLIQQQSVESDWGSKTTKACPKYREAGNVSFKRAKDHRLDLAVVFRTGFCIDINSSTLQEYLPRIRTINAVSNSIMGIWRIMDTIVPAASALSSLSELSICQKQDQHFYYSIPSEHDHMYLGYSTGVVALNEFLESLPVLRISGAHMCWDMLVFSNRLAKLRLQDINFGTDHTMMANLCHALASATGLRELEIVSIISFHESQEPFASSLGMISLPNLESLLMDNLFLNTLECILNCIITRSHRLTLHLTPNFLYFNLTGEQVLEQATQASDLLWNTLESFPIHKICIHRHLQPAAEELRAIIESVPTLDTLVLDKIALTTEYCNALERQESQENGPPSPFPSLRDLRFGRTGIIDMSAFKNMLASHSQSLRQMTFGGYVRTLQGPSGYVLGKDEDRDKEFISQFKELVPDLVLIGSDYVLPEFQQNRWQLW